MSDVLQGYLAIEGIKCIGGIYKKCSLTHFGIESRSCGTNSSLNPCDLSPTHLLATRGFLNVRNSDGQHHFSNDLLSCVTDASEMNTSVLVKGNETTCKQQCND